MSTPNPAADSVDPGSNGTGQNGTGQNGTGSSSPSTTGAPPAATGVGRAAASGPRLVPDSGPTTPLSDPSGVGVLDQGAVFRHEFDGTGGTITLPRPAAAPLPGQVRRVAVFPASRVVGGLPDFGAAMFTLRMRDAEAAPGTGAVPRDQHGHLVGGHSTGPDGTPGSAHSGVACWMPDQWTLLDLQVPDDLAGCTTIDVDLVVPDGVQGTGWLQDAGWTSPSPRTTAHHDDPEPVDWVRGARGTHSRFGHSRGNTLPLACRPHGFVHLTPLTDARTRNWLYQWAPDGGPRLQGLAFAHCPSPWIADRNQLQLMPFVGAAHHDPVARSMAFRHDDELDGVHHYRVRLDSGAGDLVAEMTPVPHGGVFRFAFPGTDTERGVLVDIPGLSHLELTELSDGRVQMEAWAASDDSGHAFPEPGFYFHGVTRQRCHVADDHDERPRWLRTLRALGRGVFTRQPRSVVVLDEGAVLEFAIATSAISVEQARHNLVQQVGDRDFDAVLAESRREWNELLGALQLSEDATDDQRVSAWSNLARLHSWPNAAHEQLPDGRVAYASPLRPPVNGPAGRTTAHEVVEGRLYVNNGFWDTYRTAWPHYALFSPELAEDLLDGTVQQYHDGGWTARWSGAGYVDCMPGASADVVFADAVANGRRFDELAAYDSAVRNGSVPAPNRFVGRKGLDRSRFAGFTASDTPEGMSWQLENAITDDAVALWSASLVERAEELGVPDRRAEFAANAAWFRQRSLSYRAHFDERIGFFQGRLPDGSWRHTPASFDPRQWGRDYTETNAWGMAATAWHDGRGLAELYGGERGLAERLDAMFATPESGTPAVAGGYADVIHEMREARSMRTGMVAMSNQPAHHVPFMYAHVGQPHKVQWWTREILDRLFVGSDLGQGYPGDEDNGEMSAWWLWAAMGLYPLHPGSGELVITAPLLREMSYDRGVHGRLTVRADHPEHRFIQSVHLDGEPWDAVTVPVSRLAGDVVMQVELGPQPSQWAAHTRPVSASTAGEQPWRDHTAESTLVVRLPDGGELAAQQVADDRGRGTVSLPAGAELVVRLPRPLPLRLLTLTRPDCPPHVDFAVQAVDADGVREVSVSPRAPLWPDQTTAFLLDGREADELHLVAAEAMQLSQVEVWS